MAPEELVFQFPHGMRTGDEMTLGDNILCDPLDTVCTPEILAALKGVYEFADKDDSRADRSPRSREVDLTLSKVNVLCKHDRPST